MFLTNFPGLATQLLSSDVTQELCNAPSVSAIGSMNVSSIVSHRKTGCHNSDKRIPVWTLSLLQTASSGRGFSY